MQCGNCGADVPGGARFCPVCGQEQVQAEAMEDDRYAGSVTGNPRPAPTQTAPTTTSAKAPDGLIGRCMREGWEAFKRRPGLLIAQMIVLFILSGIVSKLSESLFGKNTFEGQLVMNLWNLAATVIAAGWSYTALKVLRGKQAEFGELFSGFSHFWPIVIANVLTIIAVLVGLALLVIPGIIIALGLSQWMLLIMDQNVGGMEALKGSWRMMQGYKWALLPDGLDFPWRQHPGYTRSGAGSVGYDSLHDNRLLRVLRVPAGTQPAELRIGEFSIVSGNSAF